MQCTSVHAAVTHVYKVAPQQAVKAKARGGGSLTCRLKKFAMLLTLCVNTCSLKPTILPRLGGFLSRPDDLSPNLNSSSISRCFSASC
jgi:hypothetical protein